MVRKGDKLQSSAEPDGLRVLLRMGRTRWRASGTWSNRTLVAHHPGYMATSRPQSRSAPSSSSAATASAACQVLGKRASRMDEALANIAGVYCLFSDLAQSDDPILVVFGVDCHVRSARERSCPVCC